MSDVIEQPDSNAGSATETATQVVEQTPSFIELKDDSLVKLPGSDKPVKHGEWFRDYQRQHTKVSTERARLQQEFDRVSRERQAEQQELNRFRQAANQQPKKPTQSAQLAEKLRTLPYVKGEEAAAAIEALSSDLGSQDERFGTALQVIKLMASKLQEVNQTVEAMNGRFRNQDFSSKMDRYRSELGLPEEAKDFLQELYMAYEGEDLDTEFPRIARDRWAQLEGLMRAADKAKLEAARKNRFVPGRGGIGTPSKPLDTSKMSAKDIADQLWPGIQGQDS